ncbi:MAG: 50S ribosomal protein L29 [Chitinophagales bacterium]|nr:50S ribosomal protein L29 [Chitinophagales bacterium]
MPSKKYQEFVEMSVEDLSNELAANKLKLTKMRFNHAVSPLENTNVLKETRQTIARIKTELKKRELNN